MIDEAAGATKSVEIHAIKRTEQYQAHPLDSWRRVMDAREASDASPGANALNKRAED